jgi:hypothetical protein
MNGRLWPELDPMLDLELLRLGAVPPLWEMPAPLAPAWLKAIADERQSGREGRGDGRMGEEGGRENKIRQLTKKPGTVLFTYVWPCALARKITPVRERGSYSWVSGSGHPVLDRPLAGAICKHPQALALQRIHRLKSACADMPSFPVRPKLTSYDNPRKYAAINLPSHRKAYIVHS